MSNHTTTCLHKAMEARPTAPCFMRANELPHYVLDDSILALVETNNRADMIREVVPRNLLRLPYPEMLVESSAFVDHKEIRLITRIKETEENKYQMLSCFWGNRQEDIFYNTTPVYLEIDPTAKAGAGQFVLLHGPLEMSINTAQSIAYQIVSTALLMHIKGIGTQRSEAPAKLNKHRAASGKPPIPSYTLMHITHVESADGTSHAYTGRHMPVHLRAGHVKQQPHGPKNSLRKQIYVPPVIVNFTPGVEPKVPRRIVTL